MDDRVYDILICDPTEANQRPWKVAFLKRLPSRVVVQASATAALESCSRAKLDAIVCTLELAETDCWRFISLIRSGRFCFDEMLVFVICPQGQKAVLEALLDPSTILLESAPNDEIVNRIAGHLSGRTRPSVLYIEDEPAAAQAAAEGLEKYYSVELAHDGPSGLAAWQARRHQVVLLDLMLPGMTGTEVQQVMLQTKPDQRIIILTAHDSLDTHQSHVMAGACEFLPKPLNIHQLSSVIARVLRHQQILKFAENSREQAAAFNAIAAHVHAANQTLIQGRTAEAVHYLSHAVYNCRAQRPTDDQWTDLANDSLPTKSP